MHLLVATTNRNKLAEIRTILEGLPITIDTLARHPQVEEPEEAGRTFEENARLKAMYYSARTERLVVAEDSGLEISRSTPSTAHRGYGRRDSMEARIPRSSRTFLAIYHELRERGAPGRTARFICALAVADGERIVFEATGTVEGEIASTPRGEHGFGYDPIFFYPPYGRTLAEVTPEDKAAVSHRGRAFRALRTFLATRRRGC